MGINNYFIYLCGKKVAIYLLSTARFFPLQKSGQNGSMGVQSRGRRLPRPLFQDQFTFIAFLFDLR
jgi:hypothetical protein